MINLIDPNSPKFPNPAPLLHLHDGLVAVSQSLNPALLLAAYPQGIFPWYSDGEFFYWFATAPRFVLLPEKLNVARSLAKTLRHKTYRVTVNHAFAQVMAHCAQTPRPQQDGTWIAPEFQVAYTALHQQGHAHSFECWLPENGVWQLCGGLYGVQIGRVFYGESMYAHAPDASKIAFAHAVPFLQSCGIELIDCQQESAHLARFGAENMPFTDFQAALKQLNPQKLCSPIVPTILVEKGFQAAS